MPSTPRWGGLRPEPYDPDARDADGDGIVQEGTAFERPFGSRILDELGRDIIKGSRRLTRNGLQYRDRNNQPITYAPKAVSLRSEQTALGRIGLPTIGARTGAINQPLVAETSLPQPVEAPGKSTLKSRGHQPIGTGLPKLASLGHESVIDRVAPRPPKPAKVKKKLPSIRKKRSANAPTAILETYERDKARVAELHGDISTADRAHAALAKAFPRLEAPFLFNGEAEWKAKPDAPLSADERGWVTSLLVLADDHPEAAKALRVLSTDSMTHHDMDEDTNAFVTVQPMLSDDLEEDMHIFGALLAFNPDGSILPNSKKKRFGRKDKRYTGTANEYHIQELLSSKQITVDQAHELTSAYTATHEFGHVIHFTQTLKDMGIDITDPTKNDENIVKFLEIGLGKQLDLPDPDVDTLDWRTVVDEILDGADDAFYAEWDRALTAASFDALNDDQIDDFLVTASHVSEYAETGVDEGLGYEAFAELFAAEKWGIVHQPDKEVGKMRDWTNVVVGEDNGAGPAQVFTRPEREASGDLQASIDRLGEVTRRPTRVSSVSRKLTRAEADELEVREIPDSPEEKIERLLELQTGNLRLADFSDSDLKEIDDLAEGLADDLFYVEGVDKSGRKWQTLIMDADYLDTSSAHAISVSGRIWDPETRQSIGKFERTIDLSQPMNVDRATLAARHNERRGRGISIDNNVFIMNPDQVSSGIGRQFLTETFLRQREIGVDTVYLNAAGGTDDDGEVEFTGFVVWPRLGAEIARGARINGEDVSELERIVGKPRAEITTEDIRANWSELVGLNLNVDMIFDIRNGLPKELVGGTLASKAATTNREPISLEEWNSILDGYLPMSSKMQLTQKRKRNPYQLCHRPDGQPGLPLVEYDINEE